MADAWFGHGNFRIQLENDTSHTANATTQFAQVEGVDLLFQSAKFAGHAAYRERLRLDEG